MEITLDIGKNVTNDISKIADSDGVDFEIVALKLLDLGLRVHLASLNKDDENSSDPMIKNMGAAQKRCVLTNPPILGILSS